MKNKITSIEEIFPIEKIMESKLYNTQNDITIGFDVELPEVFSLSKKDYYNFSNDLRMLLRDLKVGDCFHSLNYYYEDPHFIDSENSNPLSEQNNRFYNGRPVPISDHQFFFTKCLKNRKATYYNTPFFKEIQSIFKPPFEKKEELTDINRQLISIENRIKTIPKLKSKKMKSKELQQALYRYWSLNYKNKPYKGEKLQPISYHDTLKIGDQYVYIMGIKEGIHLYTSKQHNTSDKDTYLSNIQLPNVAGIDLSMIYPVSIGLPFNHIVSTSIEILDPEKTKSNVFENIANNTLATLFGDKKAEEKSTAREAFQNNLAKNELKPCLVNFSLIITDHDYDRLQKHIDLTKAALEGINECDAELLNDEALVSFWASSPGNVKNQYNTFQNFIWQGVQYLPKEQHYHSDGKGYRMIDRYGAPRLIDLWNYPGCNNRNGVVGGPSGKGKSATINYLAHETYNNGGHVVILDKDHSYRDTTAILGGAYFDSGQKELFKFNIFLDKTDSNGNYTCDSQQLNFIYTILAYIWKENSIQIKPIEKNIIKEIIESYYHHVNQENKMPIMHDFYQFIDSYKESCEASFHNYFDFSNFKLMLKPYAIGDKKELLNNEENIDLTYQKMIAFDVAAVEEDKDYFNLLCLLIVNLVIKKLKNLPKSVRKTFIIDEALSFLKGDIGDFIGDLYATIRKKEGQIILAAQNLEYIKAATPIVQKLILSNRDWIILTNHASYEEILPDIQNLLGITDRGIEMIKTLKSTNKEREIFFSLAGDYKIFSMSLSPYALAVFDTRGTEVAKKEELKKRFSSIDTVIKQHIENNK